jgi:hypothetical protein
MNDAGNFFESLIDGTPFPQDLTRGRNKKGRVFCAGWVSFSLFRVILGHGFFPQKAGVGKLSSLLAGVWFICYSISINHCRGDS